MLHFNGTLIVFLLKLNDSVAFNRNSKTKLNITNNSNNGNLVKEEPLNLNANNLSNNNGAASTTDTTSNNSVVEQEMSSSRRKRKSVVSNFNIYIYFFQRPILTIHRNLINIFAIHLNYLIMNLKLNIQDLI